MDDRTNDSDETAHSDEENVRTSEEQNLLLYNKAIKLKAEGQPGEALKYFTKCLEGVDAANTFTKLPHCLREIAAIYYDREEYEKAVQFAQAEKLYYEAALISSTSTTSSRNPSHNNSTNDQYIRKANEYEQLASLCLKQHKIHLALEYCGKVAKLRQFTLGPSNPATVRSLDMFTVLYAEAGRQQYADALRLTHESVKDDGKVSEEPADNQKNHVENCDESEESEASKADMNDDTVDNRAAHDDTVNRTIQYSSIVYTKRPLLFFFLVSSVFAVMLSLWIMR